MRLQTMLAYAKLSFVSAKCDTHSRFDFLQHIGCIFFCTLLGENRFKWKAKFLNIIYSNLTHPI